MRIFRTFKPIYFFFCFSAFSDCHGKRRDSLLWEPELTPKNEQGNVILKDLPPAWLIDTRAAMVGTPQRGREDAPELYDAILLVRDMIVRVNQESYPDELPFNIEKLN